MVKIALITIRTHTGEGESSKHLHPVDANQNIAKLCVAKFHEYGKCDANNPKQNGYQ